MNELRETFAAWPKPADRALDNAATLIWMLKDVAPITEAGLRELGFEQYFGTSVWWLGSGIVRIEIVDDSAFFDRREIKTIGQLRLLLLGVGE